MRNVIKGRLLWWMLLGLLVMPQALAQEASISFYEAKIDNDTPYQEYRFFVSETGSTIIADIKPLEGERGGNLDTLLYLLDANGNIVAENDDRIKKVDPSSRIEFPQATRGEYRVVATRYGVQKGKSEGEYLLEIDVLPASESLISYDYDVSNEALAETGFPIDEPVRNRSQWTVLVYYGGDNNLEPAILEDFKEFQRGGGSNQSVRVVALVDKLTTNDAQLYEVLADSNGDLSLGTIGEKFQKFDSGEGKNFAQFLVWGIRHFPAQRYVVALASHGAGWRGVITDDPDPDANTNKYTILSLPELQSSYRIALAEAGVSKFDLLINDACLMSSVEYHYAMSEFFNYSIASPEIVVNPALDMTLFLNLLKANTNPTFTDLGNRLVDTYIRRDVALRNTSDTVYLTSAVTNLAEYATLRDAIEQFSVVATANIGSYATLLGDIRANAYVYSSYVGGDELVDLGYIMRQVAQRATDPRLADAAADVLIALENVFRYGNGGNTVSEFTIAYQNIYFPGSSKIFETSYFSEANMPQWANMIRSYFSVLTPKVWAEDENAVLFHAPTIPQLRIYQVYPAQETFTSFDGLSIRTEIIGRNVAYINATADLVQPNGASIRLLDQVVQRTVAGRRVNQWASGVDTTDFVWEATLPKVTMGESSNYELLKFSETVASLEGRYREPNGETWNNVSVVFSVNENNTAGTFQRVINRSPQGALADVTIPEGSTFQTFVSIITPDGRTIQDIGNVYQWDSSTLAWAWQPAPSGTYNLGILLTTNGGSTNYVSEQVTVDTSTANPDWRASLQSLLGLSVSRPKELPSISYFPDVDGFRTETPDKLSNITIYYNFYGEAPLLDTVANDIIAKHSLVEMASRRTVQLNGVEALEITYRYTKDEVEYRGRGFVIYQLTADASFGLLISAESTNGGTSYYDIVKNSLRVFQPVVCEDVACRRLWSYPESFYPIIRTWAGTSFETNWTRFDSDQDAHTFVAVRYLDNTSDNTTNLVQTIFNDSILASLPTAQITDTRNYTGKYADWSTLIFEGSREETPIYGRVYLAKFGESPVVIWFETANGESTAQIVAELLEPVVDGFNPSR